MRDTWLARMLAKHRQKGILLDANLLLVYVFALYDMSQLFKAKWTKEFHRNEAELLLAYLKPFNRVITTPNVLTEVSNRVGFSSHLCQPVRKFMRTVVATKLLEETIPSVDGFENALFDRLGLTDAVIALLAAQGTLVLTNDASLYASLEASKFDCINFAHTFRGRLHL